MNSSNKVGPVLITGELSHHIIAAIKKLNKGVEVQQHGSYLRVLVPNQCHLTRQAIEEETGASFDVSEALEQLMPSFKGKLVLNHDEATWS